MIWVTNTILVIFGPKIKLWLISISSTNFEHTPLILLRSILFILEQQIHHSSRSKPVSSTATYREETIQRLFAFVKIQIFIWYGKSDLSGDSLLFWLFNCLVSFIVIFKGKHWSEWMLWKRKHCCYYFISCFQLHFCHSDDA